MVDYRIFKLIEKLSESPKQNWTVEMMARQTNLSKDHFHKLFKKGNRTNSEKLPAKPAFGNSEKNARNDEFASQGKHWRSRNQ